MRLHALVLVGILAMLAACGGESPSSRATVADSAGVTIVTNTSAQMDEAARWTLAPRPALDIETPDSGSFTLFRVSGLATLSMGRTAVANGSPQEILVFDSTGALSGRFGRQGQGPGEFQRISSVAAVGGDSIAVYDDGARRLSVFGSDGTLSHDASLSETLTHAAASYAYIHRLAGGDLALFTGGDFNTDRTRRDGPFRPESESMRIHSDGSTVASYGKFPGTAVFIGIRGMTGSPLFAPLTDATTLGDDLVVGTERSPELRAYRRNGTLTRIIRWPDHDRTVTQARMDEFLDTLTTLVPEAQRAATREAVGKMPHADEMPPYRTLVPSDDGHLWVGDYHPLMSIPEAPPAPRHWLVFDADGTLAATIDTPAGFEPKAVRNGRVVGVAKNEVGVESVRAFAIQGM